MAAKKSIQGKVAGGSAAVLPEKLPVKDGEDPWTVAELQEVVTELESEVKRLAELVAATENELTDKMRNDGDGAGDDAADIGTKTIEREQEMSLANNQRDLLSQAERALERIHTGTYGTCEECGGPIGKARMEVFPRATLCMPCKQRQERR